MNTNRDSTVLVSELTKLYSSEDTTDFNVFDFTFAFGSVLEAMAYAKLFWPDCVHVDDVILRSDVIEDEKDASRVRQVLRDSSFDIEGTESDFNRLYIPDDFFGKRACESSDAINEYFARVLVDMWKARLKQMYPQFRFSVVLESDSDGAMSVTFHRIQDEKPVK